MRINTPVFDSESNRIRNRGTDRPTLKPRHMHVEAKVFLPIGPTDLISMFKTGVVKRLWSPPSYLPSIQQASDTNLTVETKNWCGLLWWQKRNSKTNCCLIGFPLVLCVLLVVIQAAINNLLSGSDFECGCKCVPNANGGGGCTKTCGIQYSDSNQAGYCAVPETPGWPAILQVPEPKFIAVKTTTSPELQDPACRATGTCAMTIFYTGSNRTTSDSKCTPAFLPSFFRWLTGIAAQSSKLKLILAKEYEP